MLICNTEQKKSYIGHWNISENQLQLIVMILGVFFKYHYNVYKKITTFEELSKDILPYRLRPHPHRLLGYMYVRQGWLENF